MIQVKRWKPVASVMYALIKQLNPELGYEEFCRYLQKMLEQDYFILGAFDVDELVGLVGCWMGTKFYCGTYLEIDNFVVDEAHRNCGIGALLMQSVIEEARAMDCDSITLNAYAKNEMVHRFYDRYGFLDPGKHRVLYLREIAATQKVTQACIKKSP